VAWPFISRLEPRSSAAAADRCADVEAPAKAGSGATPLLGASLDQRMSFREQWAWPPWATGNPVAPTAPAEVAKRSSRICRQLFESVGPRSGDLESGR